MNGCFWYYIFCSGPIQRIGGAIQGGIKLAAPGDRRSIKLPHSYTALALGTATQATHHSNTQRGTVHRMGGGRSGWGSSGEGGRVVVCWLLPGRTREDNAPGAVRYRTHCPLTSTQVPRVPVINRMAASGGLQGGRQGGRQGGLPPQRVHTCGAYSRACVRYVRCA